MLKLLLGFLAAVLVVLLVVQAVGPGASAEISASAAEKDSSAEKSEQADNPPPARSSSPVNAQGSSLSGGGSRAMPK